MVERADTLFRIAMIVMPRFNLSATIAFLDPFRVANYLNGQPIYDWTMLSVSGGAITASNGLTLESTAISTPAEAFDLIMVSSSWTPEAFFGPPLDAALRRWARFGAALGGIDTGAFILAAAGLLSGRRATVHYEHLDAFAELYPDVEASEDLYIFDEDRLTTCGGTAAVDLALQIVRATHGEALANATARYIFHDRLRPVGSRQNPDQVEPVGASAPSKLKLAIRFMEGNLEEPAPVPSIAAHVGLSQRQLERLFTLYVCRSPLQYYRDIRLDRARGLVTQTEMPIWEVALACGFSSPEHFSRAYRARFGLAPRTDRIEGRVPFEFRAWPTHTGSRS